MASPEVTQPKGAVPLCVDLDGTLIKTDVVWESLVLLLRHKPLYGFAVPFWLMFGRAYLKSQLARRVKLNPGLLPYNEPFIDFLKSEKSHGRTLLLVTAADSSLANCVADHSGLFNDVMASDGRSNLRGKHKGARLVERFGERAFDYAGNSHVDLPVWQHARLAIVVNASPGLPRQAARLTTLGQVFEPKPSATLPFVRSLHLLEWVRNLLVFVPLLISGSMHDLRLATRVALGFIAFCLCGSGVQGLSALLNVNSDRENPTMRQGPFASGDLPMPIGLTAFPLLLAGSAVVAWKVCWLFLILLCLYAGLSAIFYPPNRSPAVHSLLFAGLYTLRLVAGCVAATVAFSVGEGAVFFTVLFAAAVAWRVLKRKSA
jgi:hypothetical protein